MIYFHFDYISSNFCCSIPLIYCYHVRISFHNVVLNSFREYVTNLNHPKNKYSVAARE